MRYPSRAPKGGAPRTKPTKRGWKWGGPTETPMRRGAPNRHAIKRRGAPKAAWGREHRARRASGAPTAPWRRRAPRRATEIGVPHSPRGETKGGAPTGTTPRRRRMKLGLHARRIYDLNKKKLKKTQGK